MVRLLQNKVKASFGSCERTSTVARGRMAISRAKSGRDRYAALRQDGFTRGRSTLVVWLFADALKCRRWCYGATDGITTIIPGSPRSSH
jgi:hypothetical protein